MKSNLSALALCILIPLLANASDIKYSIFGIPDSLKKNANSIIRISETTFEVDEDLKSTCTVHYVLTLLNSKAIDDAELKVYYDRASSVNYLKFKIYNSFGEDITRTFKSLDVTDESATDGGTLYSDDRCKVVSPVFAQYPITIEYMYQVKDVVVFSYPKWVPVTSTNMALQEALYTLVCPKSFTPRMKSVYKVPEATVSTENEKTRYRWEIHAIPAIDTEPFGPAYYEQIPCLLLAPDHVRYTTYSDSFTSWADFGKFISFLLQGKDQLPPETVIKMNDLVKDCPDTRSKVKKVYQYMQQRTRYVGVQIGIGGWQPTPADFVDRKGYGDCKGLVNYTKALLKSVGIASYYSLTRAGKNFTPVIADFPCNQFDHVILCVPDNRDTIWLECTSQRKAFGFLGSFTDNRLALVLNDAGGTLVKTPAYSATDNMSIRKTNLKLDEAGDAGIKTFGLNKGLQSESIDNEITESPEDQRKHFLRQVGYSDCIINTLQYKLRGDFIPIGTVESDLFVPAYASKSGTRLFVSVVPPDRLISIPQNGSTRVNPVVIRTPFTDTDTIAIVIPPGYKTEFVPEQKMIESKFGKYNFGVLLNEGQLLCYRSFTLYANRYDKSAYADFIAFLKQIAKADQAKAVLTLKN